MASRKPDVRKGQFDWGLEKDEFLRRFRERFHDPAFEDPSADLDRIAEAAWDGYHNYRKSPRTRPAGPGFFDPKFPLAIEWLEARERIHEAERAHADPASASRVLLVCASSRNDKTCPGENSKTYRLVETARDALAAEKLDVDLLDLSALTAEYGRVIHPCKACVSTAMPLCHWPCSCYPNHALGQVNDWMNELYPRWVAAHGVMIVTPVHWYQAPSVLKLMMDRLVCADGGNPDPTTTRGKNPERAKEIELKGWHYPRHLAGRAFSVVVHGDAAGAGTLRRMLADWLTDMKLIPGGRAALVDSYIGYYQPYATSHDELDRAPDAFARTENAARSLAAMIRMIRTGRYQPPDAGVEDPRPK